MMKHKTIVCRLGRFSLRSEFDGRFTNGMYDFNGDIMVSKMVVTVFCSAISIHTMVIYIEVCI